MSLFDMFKKKKSSSDTELQEPVTLSPRSKPTVKQEEAEEPSVQPSPIKNPQLQKSNILRKSNSHRQSNALLKKSQSKISRLSSEEIDTKTQQKSREALLQRTEGEKSPVTLRNTGREVTSIPAKTVPLDNAKQNQAPPKPAAPKIFSEPPAPFKSPLDSDTKMVEKSDCLVIPANLLQSHFPNDHIDLTSVSHYGRETFVAQVDKETVLPLLSRGAFFFTVKSLAEFIKKDFLYDSAFRDENVIEFPLSEILPLVPKNWLDLKNQSQEKVGIVQNGKDPFANINGTADEPQVKAVEKTQLERPKVQPQHISLASEETTVQKSSELKQPSTFQVDKEDIDTLIANHPNIGDSERGLDRRSLGLATGGETIRQPRKPAPKKEKGESLELSTEEIFDNLPKDVIDNPGSEYDKTKVLLLHKKEALDAVSAGDFEVSLRALSSLFPAKTFIAFEPHDMKVSLPLSLILPKIPVDWFKVKDQSSELCEAVENLHNPFSFNKNKDQVEFIDQTLSTAPPAKTENSTPENNSNVEPEEPVVTNTVVPHEVVEEDEFELEFEDDGPEISLSQDQEEKKKESLTEPRIKKSSPADSFFDDSNANLFDDDQDISSATESSLFDDDAATPKATKKEPQAPKLEETPLAKPVELTAPKTPQVNKKPQLTPPRESVTLEKDTPKALKAPKIKETVTVTDLQSVTEDVKEKSVPKEEPSSARKVRKPRFRPSRAPNAINLNHAYEDEYMSLEGVTQEIAEAIADFRDEQDGFKSIEELMKVPGITQELYSKITGLEKNENLIIKERELNQIAGLPEERDYSLNKVVSSLQEKMDLEALILSGKNGFVIAASGEQRFHHTHSSLLAASCPQLFKRIEHFLTQSELPSPEIFSFNYEDHCISFAMGKEVFLILIHKGQFPESHTLNESRDLIHKISWYCDIRAVI